MNLQLKVRMKWYCIKGKSARPIGRKAEKWNHDAEAMAKANMGGAIYFAKSMKRKADIEDEKMEMNVFTLAPRENSDDEKEKAEYLRMMRRRYLRGALEHGIQEEAELAPGEASSNMLINDSREVVDEPAPAPEKQKSFKLSLFTCL